MTASFQEGKISQNQTTRAPSRQWLEMGRAATDWTFIFRGDSDMRAFRTVLVSGVLVLAVFNGPAEAQGAGKRVSLQMPAIPDPVRVTLDPKTTALMVLDYVEPICNAETRCKDKMLPAMIPFMKQARKAGLTVAYGTRKPNMSKWLQEVAPTASDIQVISTAQDRFYDTDLDQALKSKGIKTIIMVGWKVSGSVTYTSVGAMARGYTVVVPVDTTSAASDYETAIGFFNVLNSGNANLANAPLKPKAVTLSRTDLITFE